MRAGRLVSVLLLLQARGSLTAAQLAHELEVSERTIYRDVADLGAAGVPVYGERGQSGGYRLVEGYRTNLTGLTSEEAGALLLAGAPGAAAELGLGSLLATTRLKLLAAVPAGLRDVATRAEQRFLLDPSGWAHQRPRDLAALQTIAQAVWQDRQMRLVYRPASATDRPLSRRAVSPLGLVHKTGAWYLVAAHAAQPLVYRVDRMRSVHVLDAPATRPPAFDLSTFWAGWEAEYAARLPTFRATVRLGPNARRYRDMLGAAAPRAVRESAPEADGWVRQELLWDHVEVAVAALLALAPEIEVVEPPELRSALARSAQAVLAKHGPLSTSAV